MNRRELLAILPSLGALPFIGKEIIKEKDKIIILEPKEIIIVKEIPDDFVIHRDKLKFLMTYDKIIGSASLFEIGMSDGRLEDMHMDFPGYRTPPRFEVRATFREDQVIKVICNSRKHR